MAEPLQEDMQCSLCGKKLASRAHFRWRSAPLDDPRLKSDYERKPVTKQESYSVPAVVGYRPAAMGGGPIFGSVTRGRSEVIGWSIRDVPCCEKCGELHDLRAAASFANFRLRALTQLDVGHVDSSRPPADVLISVAGGAAVGVPMMLIHWLAVFSALPVAILIFVHRRRRALARQASHRATIDELTAQVAKCEHDIRKLSAKEN